MQRRLRSRQRGSVPYVKQICHRIDQVTTPAHLSNSRTSSNCPDIMRGGHATKVSFRSGQNLYA